jgi:hypothetical protein
MAVELRGRFNLFPIARLRSIAEVATAGFRAGQVLLVADTFSSALLCAAVDTTSKFRPCLFAPFASDCALLTPGAWRR